MEKPILAAILSCQGTSLTDAEKHLFDKTNPLGVSLFARNIQDHQQLSNLTSSIKECIGRDDALICVDQEGGRIQRLHTPNFHNYISNTQIGEIAVEQGEATALQIAELHCRLISDELRKNGLNLNYAPAVDITHPQTSAVLADRSFGSNPNLNAKLGRRMLDTYIQEGICPCLKHFPGMGRAQVDPHFELPMITSSLSELQDDFYPFRQLHNAPAGMTSHILLTAIDDQLPLTQSARGIAQIIRGELGFDGFLISDAIDMHALLGNLGERTSSSLSAGCDCVCYCAGIYDELLEVTASSTILRDKSMIRFEKIKKIFHNQTSALNFEALAAKYQQQTNCDLNYHLDRDATEILHRTQQQGEK